MRSLILYFVALILLAMVSCTDDDPTTSGDLEIGNFEAEQFEDLTLEELIALETPFEALLNTVSGAGRIRENIDVNELTATLLEILDGAKLIEIKDEVERGLDVFEIEILLASGGKLEVTLVKEVFDILEVEGQSGPFDYDIDPQGEFMALSEAFELAKNEISGDVVRWELELEEDNRWEFEIIIESESGKFEVEVDAFTGDIIGINQIEVEDEEEFEEEDEQLPENVLESVSWYIDGEIIQASSYEEKEVKYWNVYVETASGAMVKLIITEDTEDLIEARGEEGPYDYQVTPGESFITLEEAIEIANEAFEGEVYYWYFEEIWHQDKAQWAYVVKIKNSNAQYYKFGIDATTGDILFEEFFD